MHEAVLYQSSASLKAVGSWAVLRSWIDRRGYLGWACVSAMVDMRMNESKSVHHKVATQYDGPEMRDNRYYS